jgi:hypothetical protein
MALIAGMAVAACGAGSPASPGSPAVSVLASAAGTAGASPTSTPRTSIAAVASGVAASTAAGPTPRPVAAVKGTGFVDSKAFTLKAGNYIVRWALTSKDAAGCTAIGAIHSPDGLTSVEIANTSVKGKGTRSGSKGAPRLPDGSYLVTFATTCSWTANVFKA